MFVLEERIVWKKKWFIFYFVFELRGGSGTVQVSNGKDFAKANVDLLDKTMTECHR